jgi:tryptophan synthase alpha chain
MNRIAHALARRRDAGEKALMPFVTAGYPSIDHTRAILRALDGAGAAVCELGIPFSDPVADGPVIQASMTDALAAGARPAGVFDMLRAIRDELTLGVVAMVSYSIVHRIGIDAFVQQAAHAGIDGLIFPDLPLEEAAEVCGPVAGAGLTCSLLVAPTTPADRARRIAAASSGFIYAVARTGITGESNALPEGLAERVAVLREASDLPVAVGFGISRPEHVAAVVAHADAAIVGSAIVRRITDHRDQGPDLLARTVADFVRELAAGLA